MEIELWNIKSDKSSGEHGLNNQEVILKKIRHPEQLSLICGMQRELNAKVI